MHPSGRSGVNGIRVNGPSGLRAGARVHGEKGKKCVGGLTAGEMGGEWVMRVERVEGLKNGSDPEDVGGQRLTSDEDLVVQATCTRLSVAAEHLSHRRAIGPAGPRPGGVGC